MLLKAFIEHEIMSLLKSRRVYWTVILFFLLFVSVFAVRVIDYQKQINQYLADVQDADLLMQNPINYSHISPRAIHRPLIFSIYNQGYKFGRIINIQYYQPIDRTHRQNEASVAFGITRNQLDITFLITFFLSLFVLLISYDCVNGEKQTGTLRLLLTFPIKRQSFILKKILGVFIFVAVSITIPYVLSLVCLIFIYTNLLSSSFFLSAFFYWFFMLLFIFFFSLLGILLSVCSSYPSRSLVYSLLVWILFSVILPVSWDQIVAKRLFDNEFTKLHQINIDKKGQFNRKWAEIIAETKVDNSFYNNVYYDNYYHRVYVWGMRHTYKRWYKLLELFNSELYPASKEIENATDNIIRYGIFTNNVKNGVFFFNPIILFSDISSTIAGNRADDYLKFLQSGRGIRDDLISLGAREGWLFDYRFIALYIDEFMLDPEDYWWEKLYTIGFGEAYKEMRVVAEEGGRFSFDMPFIRSYEPPNPSLGEMFSRIALVLMIFVASIMTLFVLTWYKFMRYDVR